MHENENENENSKARAAQVNGCKGGTKTPRAGCLNAFKTGLYAKTSFSGLRECRKLREYGYYLQLGRAHLELLGPPESLDVQDDLIVDNLVLAKLVSDCSVRYYIAETHKPNFGMLSLAMPSVLRHLNAASRRLDRAEAAFLAQLERKKKSPAAASVAQAATDADPQYPTASDEPAPETAADANPGCASMSTRGAAPENAAHPMPAEPQRDSADSPDAPPQPFTAADADMANRGSAEVGEPPAQPAVAPRDAEHGSERGAG